MPRGARGSRKVCFVLLAGPARARAFLQRPRPLSRPPPLRLGPPSPPSVSAGGPRSGRRDRPLVARPHPQPRRLREMASLLRCLLLALFMASSSGLRLVVGSARPAAVRGMAKMALPSIEDARSLSTEEIQAEMVTAKKDLFELRKKVKTRQQVGTAATSVRHRLPFAFSPRGAAAPWDVIFSWLLHAFFLPVYATDSSLAHLVAFLRAGEAALVHAHQAPHRAAGDAPQPARGLERMQGWRPGGSRRSYGCRS